MAGQVPNHALIFGASGVSGWAVANQCLSYPSSTTFARVTALTNRPLTHADSLLPSDPRLQLVSGVDLTRAVPEITATLKDKIPDVNTVSHVFFTAYVHGFDYPVLVKANTELLRNAILAIEAVAPALEKVVLQTGGKHYGVEFSGQLELPPLPFHESAPRLPSPFQEKVFYYNQVDTLAEMSKGKTWDFTEVRPDVIVGFTPGTNAMNAAQGWGLYLALRRAVDGQGAKVPFPGTETSWKNTHTDSFQDNLAQLEIFAALHPETCGNGRAFNAINGDITKWQDKWPRICKYFGLVGTGPNEETTKGGTVETYVKTHESSWGELVKEHGLKIGIMEHYAWWFIDAIARSYDFDREYDMSEARKAGFKEHIDTVVGYEKSFERMRRAKIIP